jgi:HK97 gp10 family phage protein
MRVKGTITGDKALLAKFKALSKAVQADALENAAKAGILPIQNEAIILAPKDTTTLARSIHTETIKANNTYAEVVTGTDVEYAARQEFGFSGADALGRVYNQAAHPYMRPAYDTKRGEALSETQAALRDIIMSAV